MSLENVAFLNPFGQNFLHNFHRQHRPQNIHFFCLVSFRSRSLVFVIKELTSKPVGVIQRCPAADDIPQILVWFTCRRHGRQCANDMRMTCKWRRPLQMMCRWHTLSAGSFQPNLTLPHRLHIVRHIVCYVVCRQIKQEFGFPVLSIWRADTSAEKIITFIT